MDTNANRVVGEALKSLREERDLTQTDVAACLGKRQSFISKIESGERSLHFTDQFGYARALDMELMEFIQYTRTHLEESDISF